MSPCLNVLICCHICTSSRLYEVAPLTRVSDHGDDQSPTCVSAKSNSNPNFNSKTRLYTAPQINYSPYHMSARLDGRELYGWDRALTRPQPTSPLVSGGVGNRR